jgi:nickel-dependent lactate racemase
MRVKLQYGLGCLDVDVPEERMIMFATPKEVTCAHDKREAVELALDNPVKAMKVEALARGKGSCVIIVDDFSRPTPASEALPSILNRLNKGGMSDRNVKVIVAGGTHREMLKEEMELKVGKETIERVGSVTHHSARKMSREMFRYLGKTSFGTPVFVNKSFLEADLKIAVDCVVPHHLAGFTGGSKMIMPGVSSSESVSSHHWRSTMENLKSNMVPLGMVENSFRRDSDEVARMAGLDMSVNMVLDCKNNICPNTNIKTYPASHY